MYFYLSLIILGFMEGALILKRSFLVKYAKSIFIFSTLLIFLTGIYYSWNLYSVWQTNPVTAALLPPATPISYFIFYVFMWCFASYVLSFFMAILFLLAAQIINKKSGERFFEKEEPWLGATAIFLSGHPGWLVYLPCLVGSYLLVHVFFRLKMGSAAVKEERDSRLPLYYFWIPVALFVILICRFWLSRCFWWPKFLI